MSLNIYIYTQICSILRSTNEEKHLHPGQDWLCQFGDAGDGTSCENEFKLQPHMWEDYKGARFYDGERALVINWWLNCLDEDASGLTFEKCDPTENVDSSQMPVEMIINSLSRDTRENNSYRGSRTSRESYCKGTLPVKQ